MAPQGSQVIVALWELIASRQPSQIWAPSYYTKHLQHSRLKFGLNNQKTGCMRTRHSKFLEEESRIAPKEVIFTFYVVFMHNVPPQTCDSETYSPPPRDRCSVGYRTTPPC